MEKITIAKRPKCDEQCKLSIWFDALWKGG